MDSFLYNKSEVESLTDILHIELCSIRNLEELFYELSKQTGSRISDWDDLEEYLFYLEGCSNRGVLIEHYDMPQLYKDDLYWYLKLLQDAAGYWEANEELHRLYCIFPTKDMESIRTILDKFYCYDSYWLKQFNITNIFVNQYSDIDTTKQVILQTDQQKYLIANCEKDCVTIDILSSIPDIIENNKTHRLGFKWILGSQIQHVAYVVDKFINQYVGIQLTFKKSYAFLFYRKHTMTFYCESDNPEVKHLLVDESVSTDKYFLKEL